MKLSLQQRLGLEMRLTPQLIIQMTILQASAIDLDELVTKELEDNPALEVADDQAGAEPDLGVSLQPEERPSVLSEMEGIAEPAEKDAPETFSTSKVDDYSLAELMPADGYAALPNARPDDDDAAAVDLASEPGESVASALLPHLRAVLEPADADLAEFILASLDDDGFLTLPAEEVAENQGVPVERVEAVLDVIQRTEPGGLGCRDLRESFLVQLELAGDGPQSLARKVVSDHWDLLMKRQTYRISRLCGVDEDEVRRAVQRLLTLEMRPARRFAAAAASYVRPDFSVEWQGDMLVAVPTDETFPKLRLSRHYREILLDPKSYPPEQVKFAREKWQRALLFLRGIESRRRTLRRLVEYVIDEQHEYFVHGPEHLRPATLRDAARVLEVHPSTASRAIAGKYIESPQGIQPLSYFFKSGAGDKSRTSIKERIHALIDSEDKAAPLSDDQLCSLLVAEGIRISRRTVAKYRAELSIAGCNERRGF